MAVTRVASFQIISLYAVRGLCRFLGLAHQSKDRRSILQDENTGIGSAFGCARGATALSNLVFSRPDSRREDTVV